MTLQRGQSGSMGRPAEGGWVGLSGLLPGLFWTAGPDGAVGAVGGRWHEWTGQDPSRAVGDGWLDALHPDDASRVRSAWRAAVASTEPFAARFRVGPGLDDLFRPMVARAEPIRDDHGRPVGWSGLAMPDPDVEADAEPGPPRGEAVGDEAEDFAIFWIATREGFRLSSVSPSCERLLGWSVADLTGAARSWPDLAHPDDRPRVASAYARREAGEEAVVAYRLLRPDGSVARVRDRVLPALTDSMGDPDRILGVLEDVGPAGPGSRPAPDRGPSAVEARAEARLGGLLDGLGDLFLAFGRDGRCREANGRAVELLGPGRADVIGRTPFELLPSPDGPEGERRLRRALAGGEAAEFEGFVGRAGLWFEFRAVATADGLVVLGRDVTEQKANRLALLEVEERHRLAAEAVVGLIYDWRVDSGRVHRSPGLLGMLGIPVEEAEPTRDWWRDRVHPDDLPALDEEIARLMRDPRGEHYSFEYRVRHRDGHHVDVWDKGSCLRDESGRVTRVVGNTIDVSERRRAEHALRQADRMKDEFLGMLAHELRNPLSPILSAAQTLRAGADDPGGELRAIIERQARHMARLVDDLLDVSRVSHGKILVRPQPLDAVELVRQTLGNFGDLLREGRLGLRTELPEGPVPVLADPTRLAQCVGNLLQNAAKFTEPGGTVSVAVEAAAEGREARIVVQDTGIGIPPEILPTLFRAYSQADRSRDRSRGGLGLGLALVKSLIELQGGRVEVASDGEGRGSTFTLRLPLRVDLADRVDSLASGEHRAAAEPPAPSPRPLRLLVVDDRPDMAHILRRMLQAEGHEVEVAGDGEEALAIARRTRPEVVLSDIGLPGPIDGYGLAEALRADPETASALLIAVTGYARPDDRARALASGFDEHLTKPLDFAALCDRLAGLSRPR